MASLQDIITLKNQKIRRLTKQFDTLRTTPATGSFAMPANGRIYVRSVSGCAAGTTAMTFSGRTIQTPLLAANDRMLVGWIERGVTLTPELDFEVLVDVGLGILSKIGEG
jgi:hypothetical protein